MTSNPLDSIQLLGRDLAVVWHDQPEWKKQLAKAAEASGMAPSNLPNSLGSRKVVAVIRSAEKASQILEPGLVSQLLQQQEQFNRLFARTDLSRAFASFDYELPQGLLDQMMLFRDRLAAEVLEADLPAAEQRLRRLADERQAIVTMLDRIGKVLAACHLAGVPIPALVVVLVLVFAVMGEVADEMLREDDDSATL